MNKEVHERLRHELCYGFDPYDTERTWRGLEHIREGMPNYKLERRRYYVRKLLHLHKAVGVKDPEELGHFAACYTQDDQLRAEQFGQYDAYEASYVYYEQRTAEENEECYKEFCDIPQSTCLKPKRAVVISSAASQ